MLIIAAAATNNLEKKKEEKKEKRKNNNKKTTTEPHNSSHKTILIIFPTELCYNCTGATAEYMSCTKTVNQKVDGIERLYLAYNNKNRQYYYATCYVICNPDCSTQG